MRSKILSCVLSIAGLLGVPAFATTFNVVSNAVNGTVNIDTVTGLFTSGTLYSNNGPGPYNFVSAGPYNGGDPLYIAAFYTSYGFYIWLELPAVSIDNGLASIVGYAGSPLCSKTYVCPGAPFGGSFAAYPINPSLNSYVQAGYLAPLGGTAVPEPASWLMLGTGLSSALGLLRIQRRRSCAT